MTIKTSTFGRLELSGSDAMRFVQHMNEDKPNSSLLASLASGRAILKKMQANAALKALSK